MWQLVEGIAAEPLPVARFDELAHGELPVLLLAGTQAGEFVRIHAKGARHPDLPSIELADLLRVSPRLLAVLSTLRCHATHLALSMAEFERRPDFL
jgi:hypothetical protein